MTRVSPLPATRHPSPRSTPVHLPRLPYRRLYAAAALLLAALFVLYGFRTFQEVANTRAYDLLVDWGGAKAVRGGIDPYSDQALAMIGTDRTAGQGHPPTAFFWFIPIADLPLQSAKIVWNQVTLLLLFLSLFVIVRELELPAPIITATLLFGLTLQSSWMRDHLHVSQLSTAIAFLYVMAWYLLRRGQDLAAGLLLGLACTFKFYPGTLILLLLLVGRFRLVAGAVAGWGAIAGYMAVRIGLHSWLDFREQAKPYTTFWLAHVRNSSIQGICQRLHYAICEAPYRHRPPWPLGTYLATAIVVALVALLALVARRAARDRRTIDLPFATFAAFSIISGPYTWEHYMVTLHLPLLVAVIALPRAYRQGLSRWWVAAAAALVATTVGMLAVDMHHKNQLWDAYHYGRVKPSHLYLHFIEAVSWLPVPLLLALLVALMLWSRRRAPAAFADLRLDLPPAPAAAPAAADTAP